MKYVITTTTGKVHADGCVRVLGRTVLPWYPSSRTDQAAALAACEACLPRGYPVLPESRKPKVFGWRAAEAASMHGDLVEGDMCIGANMSISVLSDGAWLPVEVVWDAEGS